jgi:predicted ATP-binding protein involved in virulence
MILIDNICMHIYKDRHAAMIDELMNIFPNKQFFITTHSPILVGMEDKKLGISIPSFLPQKFLYPVENYQ